jgi:hypothetical protein
MRYKPERLQISDLKEVPRVIEASCNHPNIDIQDWKVHG